MLLRRSALKHGSVLKLGRSLLTVVNQQFRLQHDGRTSENSAGHGDTSSSAALHKETSHWYLDESITAGMGSKILKQRLHALGAQKVIHLTEVAKRVKTSEEAAMALDVAQQYVLRRANRQQHDGISPQTSYLILKMCARKITHREWGSVGDRTRTDDAIEAAVTMQSITKVGVEEAVEVLRKAPELKLTFGIRAFRDIIVKASKDGDLAAMRSAFQLLQAAELQPNRDLGFCIVRACFNNQRPDLAVAYAREFEVNGVGLRPAMKDQVQKAEQEIQQRKSAAKQARAAKAAGTRAETEGQEAAGESSPGEQTADSPEAAT